MPSTRPIVARRAFSLIELLVVISIIVLLIGILVPALNLVRIAARKTQTGAISTQLLNAVSQFRQDTRRLPGYFTTAEMASSDNWGGVATDAGDPGFTETENMLLELLDAVLPADQTPSFDPDEGVYTMIGPGGDAAPVTVNLNRTTNEGRSTQNTNVEGATGAYIRFGGNVLQQVLGQAGTTNNGTTGGPDTDDPTKFLDLVDPFGIPIVVWKRNLVASRDLDSTTYSLAEINYEEDASDNAEFYWASNAGYLGASSLGERMVNVRNEMGSRNASLLGGGALATDNSIRVSLASIVGSPAFPAPTGTMDEVMGGATAASDFAQPQAFRGDVIVHSAGPDRAYFGMNQDPEDDGIVGYMRFEPSAVPPGPQPGTSEVDRFDDILQGGD